MKNFVKQNKRPLKIKYTNPIKSEPKAYFVFHNKRYYMDEAIRTHENPWATGKYPDYIHGYITDWYGFRNLYIEVCADNETVNIYQEAIP